jgi:hypothetical protein
VTLILQYKSNIYNKTGEFDISSDLSFTMTSEMVADAAMAFRHIIACPYHCGDNDTSKPAALVLRIIPMSRGASAR